MILVTTSLLTSLETYSDSLGVRIREAPVPFGFWGVYDHHRKLITLKPRMAFAQRQSTLAHELGHATYGHHGHHPKTERIADKWAARRLLSIDLVLQHAKVTVDLGDLSASLDVMPWVVSTFVEVLPERDLRWMIRRLREAHY